MSHSGIDELVRTRVLSGPFLDRALMRRSEGIAGNPSAKANSVSEVCHDVT